MVKPYAVVKSMAGAPLQAARGGRNAVGHRSSSQYYGSVQG
ncbi:MAG TPA: hypothetical protein VEL69_07610 [Ktedonobacteraceae bacterium]|nr:hypothetical protein [Ktedonobacteraceae bacterium]